MVNIKKPTIPGIHTISNIWKIVQEIDLRPIRDEAERSIHLAIVGKKGVGKQVLANFMRTDPVRRKFVEHTPIWLIEPANVPEDLDVDLIILLIDASSEDFSLERKLLSHWQEAGREVLSFFAVSGSIDRDSILEKSFGLYAEHQVLGSVDDLDYLQDVFVPVVVGMLPDDILPLGRQFPLFRRVIARKLIDDTCVANAIYSFSTGLAEVIPVFDIPLNVADIVVLTKAQAFLIYKLGLALGYSDRWQDYVAEFGSVLGGGFLWRQVARQLIGLIPVWGIVPKTAVAYAGTYAIGQVVLLWYLTGRHVDKSQLVDIYRDAFRRGKILAKSFTKRQKPFKKRIYSKTSNYKLLSSGNGIVRICPRCGLENAPNAGFCNYCGVRLE